MRIGSIVYATDSGLGILAKSFWDAGVLTDILIMRHGRHTTHLEWYPPGTQQITNLRDFNERQRMAKFCEQMDSMLFFETPFWWPLMSHCSQNGTKTYLMTMHECTPAQHSEPDFYLCPSLLDYEIFKERVGARAIYLPVPVKRAWSQRTKAKVFVHYAGHGGLKGRNGTKELLEAIPLVQSDAQFLIRSQEALKVDYPDRRLEKVIFQWGTHPYDQLYTEGDVFVFPEKFNGLSLPLQEAYASGMLVMATKRFPNTEYLPNEPLISVQNTIRNKIGPPYMEFDEAVISPKTIAATIDAWYGQDISELSRRGKQWAEDHSWEALKPEYLKVLS